ncbi:MAG TPA: NAD(P)H-dependent oxidoreductase, partial [Solirubrobacteraceae bacterium]
MRVLAISGSLRRDSHNQRLLRAAANLLPPEAELVEYTELKAIPAFDEDDENAPAPAVQEWREAIQAADALLFATPEYNSSIPGQLKNALDWASRPSAQA